MDIFEIIKIFIVSLIEGITEWLPISSTGHMILFDEFAKLGFSPQFKDLFFVVIQLGAICAITVTYFSRLNPFSSAKNKTQKHKTFNLWRNIIVAAIPAMIAGLLFDDFMDEKLNNPWVIVVMLILYGVIFIVLESYLSEKNKKPKTTKTEEMSVKEAVSVGLFQVLSLVPGTSRSGSTILGGLITGLSREVAVEFSFFLGIPIMLGASSLKILKFLKSGFVFSSAELFYLVFAVIITFIVSMFVVRALVKYLKSHDFKVFGWYRIILGIIVLLYFIFK